MLTEYFNMSLNDWGSIWAIIAGTLALVLIVWQVGKFTSNKYNIGKIYACYLKPQWKYPGTEFSGAPINEEYPCDLNVSNDGYYTLFIQIHSPKLDIMLDRIYIGFVGPDENKPKTEIANNPFIVEKLEDDHSRDWWGDIHKDVNLTYPRPLYRDDCLMKIIKVHTFGQWTGKILVAIYVREMGEIKRHLSFIVSNNIDDVPYLNNLGVQKGSS